MRKPFRLALGCVHIVVYHNITDRRHLTSLDLEVAHAKAIFRIDLQETAVLAALTDARVATRRQQLFRRDGAFDLAMR